MLKPEISIIIVNYNTKDFLNKLLLSIYRSRLAKIKIETIVSDNNSLDGSRQLLKNFDLKIKNKINLKTIFNKENLGYAKANNKAIKIAKGKYVLFLNSDTLLTKDVLIKTWTFMEKEKEASVVSCKIELENGSLDKACHRGFPTPLTAFTYFSGLEKLFPRWPLFSQYHQAWKNLHKIHQVDVISGAFFLIRKKVLDKVGYFDERFFLYFEDTDLCRRFWKNNWQVIYYPEAKIIHNHNRAIAKTPIYKFFLDTIIRSHIFSWFKYILKWGIK